MNALVAYFERYVDSMVERMLSTVVSADEHEEPKFVEAVIKEPENDSNN